MKATGWTLVTAPTQEPLTLGEVSEHLRVDSSDENTLILDYISAARSWAETYTGRALMPQTWDAHFSRWPGPDGFELPMPPLTSVTSIKYTPAGGAQVTLSASVYAVVTAWEPGRVLLAYNQEWPSDELAPGLPIVVRFVCGYADPVQVPPTIRQGIRWLVGHMHENREAVTMGSLMPQQVPMSARWALDPFRLRYEW